MNPLLLIGGAIAAGLFFLKKSEPVQHIAVYTEDSARTEKFASWHPTPEQTRRFGPIIPSAYTYDEGGLFLFAKSAYAPSVDDAVKAHSIATYYATYKPDWKVVIA